MKTILYNSVYVNPYAYNVFPLLAYPEKEEENFVESCKIVGLLDILNLNDGTIDTYKQVNSIDFSKYAGSRIEISLYTKDGAVLLGEWLIPGEVTPPYNVFSVFGLLADNELHWVSERIDPVEGKVLSGYIYSWSNSKIADIEVEVNSPLENHITYELTKLDTENIGDYTHEIKITIGPNTADGTLYPNIKLTQITTLQWISFVYTLEKQVVAAGNAGDICLYDKTNDKLIIVANDDFSAEKYPLDSYSPVGVVVIPKSHNVYSDGSCGVISLKEMNYGSPDDGSTSYKAMGWGGYGTDISTLTNYDQVCYVGSNDSVGESVIGTYSYAYLPSDKFSTIANPYDTETSYYNYSDRYNPSPYKNDESFNTEYSRTSSPSNTSNAMSDFDGVGNTQILTDLATSDSNWKTENPIANSSGAGYYPAACCCWRYHTLGTNQGDWYLPACGELGYIMPRFNKIQEAIQKMITAYGSSVGVSLNTSYSYWSSSEHSNNYARRVHTDNGYVYGSYKYGECYVRAFLRVK